MQALLPADPQQLEVAEQARSPIVLRKRKRLNFACNLCRQKKTRCDEGVPQCRTCELAGEPCITTDKRRKDGHEVARRRTGGEETYAASSHPTSASPLSVEMMTNSGHAAGNFSNHHGPLYVDPMDKVHLPMIPSPLTETDTIRQATQWLQIAFGRIHRPSEFLAYLSGTRTTAADVPLGQCLSYPGPELPSRDEIQIHSEVFFTRVHPIFPFISRSAVDMMVTGMYNTSTHGQLRISDVPPLGLTYLICAIGLSFSPRPKASQDTVDLYISYCNTLFEHLTANRSAVSVQVILLFAILLRLRDQLTWSYDVLLVATSMAQSVLPGIGIDRRQSAAGAGRRLEDSPSGTLRWCLYAFERLLAFEVRREPILQDDELSTMKQSSQSATVLGGASANSYAEVIISLANLLSAIQQRSSKSWGQDEMAGLRESEAVSKILRTAAEIEWMIERWYDALAPEYRAGYELPHDTSTASRRSFLLFYYYQMKVILYRNAMLRDRRRLAQDIAQLAEDRQERMQKAPESCAEAAAALIRLLASSADGNANDYTAMTASPVLAGYALGVYVINEPRSLMSRPYFEYVKLAMRLSLEQNQRCKRHVGFEQVLNTFATHISNALEEVQQPPVPVEVSTDIPDVSIDPVSLGNDPLWDTLGDWVSWDLDDWSIDPIGL